MKNILKLFSILYLIPFSVAVFMAFKYLLGGWGDVYKNHEPNFYFLPELDHVFLGLCVCIVGFGVLLVIIYLVKRISNLLVEDIVIVSLIFVISVGIRSILIYMFREDLKPFSDFAYAWDWAQGTRTQEEVYMLFPAYLNYASYLEIVIKVFGYSYINVLFLNAIWSGTTSVLTFFLAKYITDNRKVAMLSALLYACMPSDIVYNTIGNPEFLTIAFITLSVLLLVKTFDSTNKKQLLLFMLAGVSLGIGSSFKSFGGVVIIACSMIAICKMLLDVKGQAIQLKGKRVFVCILSICCLLFAYKLMGDSIERYTERKFSIYFEDGALQHFLTVGLNRQGEGQLHVGELSGVYRNRFIENGGDAEEAAKFSYNAVVDDWKGNLNEIPEFTIKKLIWTWQDNGIPIYYFNNSVGVEVDTEREEYVYDFSNEYLPSIAQVYYFLLMLFSLIGVLGVCRKKVINHKLNLCYLIILGYFGMMLLSEAQSRYKCLIMPFVCITATVGIYRIGKKITQVIKN